MSIAAIRVLNPLLYPRVSTFQCVVPFVLGDVWNVDTLTIADAEAVDMQAFGQPWPDGSVRFARCWGRVAMGAGETKELQVEVGARPMTQSIDVALPATFLPDGATPQMELSDLESSLSVAARSTLSHLWGRCWAKWHLAQDLHQPVIHFSLTIGYSEPQTTDLFVTLQDPIEVVLPVTAGLISVPHGPLKGVSSRIAGQNQITTFLPAGTKIAHGQAHGWQGVFMAPQLFLQEQRSLLAVATNWGEAGCGPLLQSPPYPAWMPSQIAVRVNCERKILTRPVRRDPWYEPQWGLGRTSAETGAQDDFGTIHGLAGFLGCPEWLDLAVPDALQEWCRPTHFREADGSPFRSSAHPLCNMWMGRPHEAGVGVSPDQLGKPPKNTWSTQQNLDYETATHGWRGMDPQHTSLLNLTAAAMLTGDDQLFDLLDDYAETYLASYTVPSTHPHHFSSTMDAARAVGRCGYTTSWLNLLLGRGDVQRRVDARIREVVLPQWTATAGKTVRPLDRPARVNLSKYLDQNNQPLPNQPPEWHPWQEGIAVFGLLCIHMAQSNPQALEIAQGIGETFVMYGWEDRGAYFQIGKAIEWTGDPVPTGGTDTRKYLAGDGTDYAIWNLAALQWLARYATKPEVQAKAAQILVGIHAQRPSDGFFSTFDRYSIEEPT